MAVLGVLAVLLGMVLTLTISWLRLLATDPPDTTGGRPIPSLSGLPSGVAAPSGTALTRAEDPSIAPLITGLNDRGTSLGVTWIDRSGGKAVFVVIEVTGSGGVPLTQVEAGRTSVVVEGVDPKRSYCLAVLAITPTAQAVSPLECTGVRGATR